MSPERVVVTKLQNNFLLNNNFLMHRATGKPKGERDRREESGAMVFTRPLCDDVVCACARVRLCEFVLCFYRSKRG